MSDQEAQAYFQETECGDGVDFATTNHFLEIMHKNLSTAAIPISCPGDRRIPTTSKRQSPSSLIIEGPKSKKVALHNLPAPTPAVYDGSPIDLKGFTRQPLPNASPTVLESPASAAPPTPPSPTLRRTVSDMAGALDPCYRDSLAVSRSFLNHMSPEIARTVVLASTPSPAKASSSSANFLSVAPPLYRSSSAPVPDSYCLPISSPDPINKERPTSQRLKRTKSKMSRWWNEVIRGGEEDGLPENNNNYNNYDPKVEYQEEEEEAETVHETEEGVSVEKTQKGLKVQIKCPCGKGYHVFFTGENCYYQLI